MLFWGIVLWVIGFAIRWNLLNGLMHKFRNAWIKLFRQVGLADILPYWGWKFGGGPVPIWSFRLVLAILLLLPIYGLKWTGLEIYGDYYLFPIGFFTAEIVQQAWRNYCINKFVGGVMEKNPEPFEKFMKSQVKSGHASERSSHGDGRANQKSE